MLKLQTQATFTALVAISCAGQAKPAEIEVEFKYLKRSAYKDYFERIRQENAEDAQALAEIIVGWKGVDTPYSPEALAQLLDGYPASGRELFSAFTRELMESKAKN